MHERSWEYLELKKILSRCIFLVGTTLNAIGAGSQFEDVSFLTVSWPVFPGELFTSLLEVMFIIDFSSNSVRSEISNGIWIVIPIDICWFKPEGQCNNS